MRIIMIRKKVVFTSIILLIRLTMRLDIQFAKVAIAPPILLYQSG